METVPYCEAVEVLYPIQQAPKSNKFVFRKDDLEWDYIQKSASLWRHEFVTLAYKVRDTEIEDFYNFFVDNKGLQVTLATAGMNPFPRETESNTAYILTFKKPKTITQKMYTMNVTFLNVVITASTP